jgi:hypothetical protein
MSFWIFNTNYFAIFRTIFFTSCSVLYDSLVIHLGIKKGYPIDEGTEKVL